MPGEYHLPPEPRPSDIIRLTDEISGNPHELLIHSDGRRLVDWDRVSEVDMSLAGFEAEKTQDTLAKHDPLMRARKFFGRKAISETEETVPMPKPEVESDSEALTQPLHRSQES